MVKQTEEIRVSVLIQLLGWCPDIIVGLLDLEDGAHMLSRNVDNYHSTPRNILEEGMSGSIILITDGVQNRKTVSAKWGQSDPKDYLCSVLWKFVFVIGFTACL